MARAASIFRWVISVVWAVLLVPFLLHAWNGVLDREDVSKHPVDWLMSVIGSVAQFPGVLPGVLITTGVVVGAWIDWLLRKVDGSRAQGRIVLGRQFVSLAGMVSHRQEGFHSEWPGNMHDLQPTLMSAFIKAEAFGLWAPVDELYERKDGAAILVNYLRLVGTMLRDGHFKQAVIRAQQAKDFIETSGVSNAERA
jgi:hypothetical protein